MSGLVVWITGLPSSGKSTLAERVCRKLAGASIACAVLDGDAVRAALRPKPGYDERARADFYETLANLAALLAHQGFAVLVPATANKRVYRDRARARAPRYLEVYVHTDLETCAERDAKGLYAASRRGDVTDLPGATTTYEPPSSPDILAAGGEDEIAAQRIVDACLDPS